jgi:hypothetical protein
MDAVNYERPELKPLHVVQAVLEALTQRCQRLARCRKLAVSY